jgi:hypothetical protein
MATVGSKAKKNETEGVHTDDGVPLNPTGDPGEENAVDYLKDAPEERPYEKAITQEHREFLDKEGDPRA